MFIVQTDPYLRLVPAARIAGLCRSILSELPDPCAASDSPADFEPSKKRQKTEFKISPAALKVLHEAAEAGGQFSFWTTRKYRVNVYTIHL